MTDNVCPFLLESQKNPVCTIKFLNIENRKLHLVGSCE